MSHDTKVDTEKVREIACKPAIDAMESYCALDRDKLDEAIVAALLASSGDAGVDEDTLSAAIKFARETQMQAAALQFVLCGVSEFSIQNGEPSFRLRGPDLAMAALVKYGIAKPV